LPEKGLAIDENAARELLKRQLPGHMIPSLFVVMESMPLTPSGKIDRRRLPEPAVIRDTNDQGSLPASPTEVALAGIWKKLLAVESVYLDDNFFDLGGHSLLTIKLIQEIEKATGERLTIADVFENPTIGELATLFEATDWKAPADIHRSALQVIMDKFTLWFTRP
jgi:acyl carrier protein